MRLPECRDVNWAELKVKKGRKLRLLIKDISDAVPPFFAAKK